MRSGCVSINRRRSKRGGSGRSEVVGKGFFRKWWLLYDLLRVIDFFWDEVGSRAAGLSVAFVCWLKC